MFYARGDDVIDSGWGPFEVTSLVLIDHPASKSNNNFKISLVPPLQILANAATNNRALYPNTTSLNSSVKATYSSSATSSASISNAVLQMSESSITASSINSATMLPPAQSTNSGNKGG